MKTSSTSSESKTPAVALAPAGFPIVGIGASAGGLEKTRKELAVNELPRSKLRGIKSIYKDYAFRSKLRGINPDEIKHIMKHT